MKLIFFILTLSLTSIAFADQEAPAVPESADISPKDINTAPNPIPSVKHDDVVRPAQVNPVFKKQIETKENAKIKAQKRKTFEQPQ